MNAQQHVPREHQTLDGHAEQLAAIHGDRSGDDDDDDGDSFGLDNLLPVRIVTQNTMIVNL